MAHVPLLFTLFSTILLLSSTVSSTTTPQTTSTVGKGQVPHVLCIDCDPHYSPPPPPKPKHCPPPPKIICPPPPPKIICPPPPPPVIERPPPPPPVIERPPPPPPAIERPPPPPPAIERPPPPLPVIERPPPPKPKCVGKDVNCLPSLINPYPGTPEGSEYLSPPFMPYPPGIYLPPGTINFEDINGANTMMPHFSQPTYFTFFTFVLLNCFPYYFFI